MVRVRLEIVKNNGERFYQMVSAQEERILLLEEGQEPVEVYKKTWDQPRNVLNRLGDIVTRSKKGEAYQIREALVSMEPEFIQVLDQIVPMLNNPILQGLAGKAAFLMGGR